MSNIKISKRKRIVIKIGTSTITHHRTGMLNIRRMEKLVKVISDLKNTGFEIVLVSSGSIGLGAGKLGLNQRPATTMEKQACAAVGQCELMYIYDKYFSEYGINIAQVLLTKYILLEDRRENVINGMNQMISYGTIPIVNENDTVAIDELELEVGENDTLAAIVAGILDSDLLIIMSDIEGLFTGDPREDENAKLIKRVETIDERIRSYAGGAGTKFGTGGMASKIDAVERAFKNDIDVVLMSGKDPEKLYDLFEDKPVGTFFSKRD
ncbi:MAG: glutamate 5-kinase [Lachnospiraceae bacterium]|nr:glutamate 5-kinase [Lachnospiraceae bacterium]